MMEHATCIYSISFSIELFSMKPTHVSCRILRIVVRLISMHRVIFCVSLLVYHHPCQILRIVVRLFSFVSYFLRIVVRSSLSCNILRIVVRLIGFVSDSAYRCSAEQHRVRFCVSSLG